MDYLTALTAATVTTVAIGFGVAYAKTGNKPKPVPAAGGDMERQSDVNAITKGICPDCGDNGSLLTGPSGGMSINVACNSCLMEFNVHGGFNGIIGVDHSGKLTADRARLFGIGGEEYSRVIAGLA